MSILIQLIYWTWLAARCDERSQKEVGKLRNSVSPVANLETPVESRQSSQRVSYEPSYTFSAITALLIWAKVGERAILTQCDPSTYVSGKCLICQAGQSAHNSAESFLLCLEVFRLSNDIECINRTTHLRSCTTTGSYRFRRWEDLTTLKSHCHAWMVA